MNDTINKVFLGFAKRAERIEKESLVASFVNVGPLLDLLSTVDHQVLYGRRGTGKTHALVYLAETLKQKGDLAVYVDLRLVGSTGGIYNDFRISVPERATRLILDTLAVVHDELVNAALGEDLDISLFGPLLDEFAEAITEVQVHGQTEEERILAVEDTQSTSLEAGIEGSMSALKANLQAGAHQSTKTNDSVRIKESGTREYRVHFGRVGNTLKRLSDAFATRRIWILLDEWSAVPSDLQPYLADLLRRSVFPISSICVKIAAIEKRSTFLKPLPGGDYVGIELGADATADLNLDDFMVFDNDEQKAVAFYRSLLFRRFLASCDQGENKSVTISTAEELTRNAFTQDNVFREFVRAAEGYSERCFFYFIVKRSEQRWRSDLHGRLT